MTRNTRERLIDAAGDLFYTDGFQAVGLDRVRRAVGITKTAFYKHFESKDDLILAVLDQRDRQDIADAIAHMRRGGGDDPRAQILAFFDLLAEWFEQPNFRGCLFMNAATEFASPADPIHRAAAAHAQHIAAELLLRVRAAGVPQPELVTRQLMLLISGAIAARHAANAVDAAATARRTAAMLLSDTPRAPARESRAAGRIGTTRRVSQTGASRGGRACEPAQRRRKPARSTSPSSAAGSGTLVIERSSIMPRGAV
jgi:AcrR family transcriptional regulator